jgi:hypothetical protein
MAIAHKQGASSSRGREAGSLLAALAGLAALVVVSAYPTTSASYGEANGVRVLLERHVSAYAVTFVVLQAVATVTAITAAVLAWRGRTQPAIRLLLVAGLTGLVPSVLPGILALTARYLLVRTTR